MEGWRNHTLLTRGKLNIKGQRELSSDDIEREVTILHEFTVKKCTNNSCLIKEHQGLSEFMVGNMIYKLCKRCRSEAIEIEI
tara:strand:- start:1242 stop:1487 length:246 start_codon:yes stop_codon:yes gene_type:complete